MQEEVENRTVNIVVMTTRLTARALMDGIRRFLNQRSTERLTVKDRKIAVKTEAKMRRKEQKRAEGPHGKQTVKQLVRNGGGLKQVPVQGEHLKEFERVLKKYGVDFAVTKENGDSSRYLVFFKAKDEAVLSGVITECMKKQLGEETLQKPSVRNILREAKELAAARPARTHQKEKDLSL